MSVVERERVREIGRWLALDIDDGPAGPLFSSRYAEHEITMTTGAPDESYGNTGCAWCSGSYCPNQGWVWCL